MTRPRFIQWIQLPVSERWLVVEAAFWMGLARLAILIFPFRWLASRLGHHMAESPEVSSDTHRYRARQISRSVKRAGRHLPWDCTCLVSAMAAMAMLRRRGQGSTLYLGVNREDEDQLAAHAWLRTGDTFVTGGRIRHDYAVVGYFMKPDIEQTHSDPIL